MNPFKLNDRVQRRIRNGRYVYNEPVQTVVGVTLHSVQLDGFDQPWYDHDIFIKVEIESEREDVNTVARWYEKISWLQENYPFTLRGYNILSPSKDEISKLLELYDNKKAADDQLRKSSSLIDRSVWIMSLEHLNKLLEGEKCDS